MTDEQRDKKYELLANQCRLLMQSFDTVQIFTTKFEPEEGSTCHFIDGRGNWCARFGQIKAWIVQEEGQLAAHGAKKEIDE